MARQPFQFEIDAAEEFFRALGPTVTLGLQKDDRWLSGELWTVHKPVGGTLGIGQGATLSDALKDLHAVVVPAEKVPA